jgi:hypothetical protein
MLEKTNDAQVIRIKNSLGKLIDSRKEVFRENKYHVHGFAAGVYTVEVVYADKIIRKKMVIN